MGVIFYPMWWGVVSFKAKFRGRFECGSEITLPSNGRRSRKPRAPRNLVIFLFTFKKGTEKFSRKNVFLKNMFLYTHFNNVKTLRISSCVTISIKAGIQVGTLLFISSIFILVLLTYPRSIIDYSYYSIFRKFNNSNIFSNHTVLKIRRYNKFIKIHFTC